MKYTIFLFITLYIAAYLTGCASNPIQERRDKTLKCTKELIEYDSGTKEAYIVCRDLYSRSNREK